EHGGEVDDAVDVGGELEHRGFVADVAEQHLDVVAVEAAVVVVENQRLVASVDEGVYHVAADEAGTAGDPNLHRIPPRRPPLTGGGGIGPLRSRAKTVRSQSRRSDAPGMALSL